MIKTLTLLEKPRKPSWRQQSWRASKSERRAGCAAGTARRDHFMRKKPATISGSGESVPLAGRRGGRVVDKTEQETERENAQQAFWFRAPYCALLKDNKWIKSALVGSQTFPIVLFLTWPFSFLLLLHFDIKYMLSLRYFGNPLMNILGPIFWWGFSL